MNELPPSWAETTLGDACDVILGQSPPGSAYNTDGVGLPFFQGKAEFGSVHPTVRKWTTVGNKTALAGDVLLSVRAPVGPTNLATGECVIGRGLAALRPKAVTTTQFLLWWMRASESSLADKATGSTFSAVSGRQVRNHPIPLPPLAEQHRIVDAIEERFSRLDAAGVSLRRARSRLATFRHVTLTKAVSGAWPTVELGDIVRTLRNGAFLSRPAPKGPGVRIFRISAVRPLRLDLDDVRFAQKERSEVESYFVEAGDLLFTRYNGNPNLVGACAVVPAGCPPTIHPDKLIRVVIDDTRAYPPFIALAVSVGEGRAAIAKRLKTTAGQVGISGGQLRTVHVPLPPLDVQRSIVDKVGTDLAAVDRLQAALVRAEQQAARLRHSVLEQAFAGKLAEHDPFDKPASTSEDRLAPEVRRRTQATHADQG